MSKNEPLTILKDGQAEFTVQRSRFIAYAAAVHDEEEARSFIARLRKEHYDARHCCSAWILGADGAKQKSSDDGEPGGTAGMPILEVMKRRGLTDAAVAVVRYFGGIKLGAGGLVRAYSHAASLGVDAA
ncbi:MAG: YigZ family protein, partial [Schwartzia sp.]|nr:YigZ family protein [Schwartzia sp. (in: firmicutes)]